MMNKLFCALVLLFAISAAHAIELPRGVENPFNTLSEPKNANAPTLKNVSSPPAVITLAQHSQSLTHAQPQNVEFYSESQHATSSENANHAHQQAADSGVKVSPVPVPAAFPFMATALGIYGIARRRKTFK